MAVPAAAGARRCPCGIKAAGFSPRSPMPSALVIGGGLSGLAAAAALGGAGFDVDLYEARGFLGGRAASYPIGDSDSPETIDNCQHILLRCCVNLLDFYDRLGARERIRFYRDFTFLEPGGRVSSLRGGRLPSFLRLRFLGLKDKLGIARGLLAIKRQRHRTDLGKITMLDWLRKNGQTERAIERFWKQGLVSAIN